MSVGAYVWGEALVLIKEQKDDYGFMSKKVIATVWDSPFDVDGTVGDIVAAIQMARNAFGAAWPLKNALLEAFVKMYLKVLDQHVTAHYKKASKAFEHDYVRCPTLIFCSKNSTLTKYETVQRLAQRWGSNGNFVSWSMRRFKLGLGTDSLLLCRSR